MAETKSSGMSHGAGKPVLIEKSLAGLDGWLAFHVVVVGASVVGYIWAFFLAIAGMANGLDGVALGVALETMIFSLALIGLCGWTLFLLVNRRKAAKLWAYVTLGVSAVYATTISVTTMFTSYESCSYGGGYYLREISRRTCETIHLSSSEIITLVGGICAAWAVTLLVAYYFKKSQRAKLTLNK